MIEETSFPNLSVCMCVQVRYSTHKGKRCQNVYPQGVYSLRNYK